MTKLFTLCFIHHQSRILLGMKKRGFGAGRWNGFGGKVQPGETIEDAARRELLEEAGLTVGKLSKKGIIDFTFQGQPDVLKVHIFSIDEYAGEPVEGEEMKPQWFAIDAIPYKDMWPDDIYWLPLFLAGKTFTGAFTFGPGDTVLEKRLEETSL